MLSPSNSSPSLSFSQKVVMMTPTMPMPRPIHTSVHCSFPPTADTCTYGVLPLLSFLLVGTVVVESLVDKSIDNGSSNPAFFAHAWRSSL